MVTALLKNIIKTISPNIYLRRGMAKVAVNGVSINYETAGKGPHVALCLPGALGSARTDFAPQLKAMADSQHVTLIAWDPPGYGLSRPPDRHFGSDFFRDDAKMAGDFMEVLGHARYSLLGWSDGGNTAVLLAAARPEQVTRLVIWGANSYVSDKDLQLYEAVRDVDQWSERMRAPMVEMYGEEYFRTTWSAWVDAIAAYKNNKNGICMSETAQVRCPTLIVHGSKDAMVPEEHPQYFHKHIPNSKLHVFPEGKHNLHMRYAEEFNQLITGFLTSE